MDSVILSHHQPTRRLAFATLGTHPKARFGVEFSEEQRRHLANETINTRVSAPRDFLESLVLVVSHSDRACANAGLLHQSKKSALKSGEENRRRPGQRQR
jgi:hypothetical protein